MPWSSICQPFVRQPFVRQPFFSMRLVSCLALLVVPALAAVRAEVARAELVRFEILAREPFAGGQPFGEAGAYERIVGRVHYALDPKLPQNREVVDLPFAPMNDQGKVEFTGDLFILAPQDPNRGNGAIFYDVNNRGNKLALRFFNYSSGGNNPRSAEDAGDGFLMRQGFTVVWSGWDGELAPGDDRLRLAPPVAGRPDQPITGPVRCEIVPDEDTTRTGVSRANHGSYRPTAKGLTEATLTRRSLPADPRQTIPRDQWKLHVQEVESDLPNQLPIVELEVPAGLQKGQIYELIYEAQEPLVHGTCFTALRDLIAALKHGTGQDNPLLMNGEPTVKRAFGFGVSQSGRFLREFVYWGFNQDEQGRQVFEGLMPHVSGAGLGSFNHRFAQPTRHGAQHDHHEYPSDRFPFAYETQHDPLSGQTTGILQRSERDGTVPLILHTQSVSEYWNRSGSLTHTDPLGAEDAQAPDNVRIYFFGGTQHGPSGFPPARGKGQTLANPGDYKPFLRCLLLALERWSRDGQPAPASVYPTIKAGTLVAWQQTSTGFPELPGIRYPGVIQQPAMLDFGPRWLTEQIADKQPPTSRGDYRVLVPRSDADGNDVGCLSPPEVAVPVATYTGWNLRSADAGAENQLVTLQGSYIPFPITRTQREQSKDPRRSLEERYGTLDAYLEQLEAHCQALRADGYLLADDIPRILTVQRERVAPLFATIEGKSER